ncbi:MAG: hypothetical protein OEY11_04565 [Gammaproteobacteria bacterium]|nr:hypothetical protein [Gammaproteobacteria bacterium]
MKLKYSFLLGFFLLGVIPSMVFAAEQSVSTGARVERVLVAPQMGRWQVIGIPQQWLLKHWEESTFQSLYIALRGPHADDLGNYAPCHAPSRLVVGLEDQDDNRKEYLLACLYSCSANDSVKKVYRDLWARNTHLEGITAQLLVDGKIEIVEHYVENLGLERKHLQDIAVVEKNRYGKEKRLRVHQFSVSDLKKAVKQKANRGCLNGDKPRR